MFKRERERAPTHMSFNLAVIIFFVIIIIITTHHPLFITSRKYHSIAPLIYYSQKEFNFGVNLYSTIRRLLHKIIKWSFVWMRLRSHFRGVFSHCSEWLECVYVIKLYSIYECIILLIRERNLYDLYTYSGWDTLIFNCSLIYTYIRKIVIFKKQDTQDKLTHIFMRQTHRGSKTAEIEDRIKGKYWSEQ